MKGQHYPGSHTFMFLACSVRSFSVYGENIFLLLLQFLSLALLLHYSVPACTSSPSESFPSPFNSALTYLP